MVRIYLLRGSERVHGTLNHRDVLKLDAVGGTFCWSFLSTKMHPLDSAVQ